MEALQDFALQHVHYGYPLLFAGVLLENAGIPLPGETAVLLAGFLSSPAGGSHFNISVVIIVVACAAIIGDNAGFWLGHRWARPRLQRGRGFLFLTPKTLQLAEGYFTRYGVWTIFFARFIAGLRIVGALAAGTAGMSWPHFFAANAAGAVAWAVTMSLLGFFFGHSWELLHKWLGRGALIVLGCLIVIVGLPYLLKRLRQTHVDLWQRLARTQIGRGALVALLEVVCIALLVLSAQGRRPTRIDQQVDEVLGGLPASPLLGELAKAASMAGTLPVALAAVVLVLAYLGIRRRSWRESVALLWVIAASEAVGFLLLALLRSRDVLPVPAVTWPFGFSGIVPLRFVAVFGMIARLLFQPSQWITRLLTAAVILLPGFAVLWLREQTFTEILLEYAAGALVLFGGVWWLEGYGPGLRVAPGQPEATTSSPQRPIDPGAVAAER